MPTIAADTASVAAPGTPALSNSGANASPVAGPPVSVTDPASTPNSGCSPSAIATTAPSTFCSAAAIDATTIITAHQRTAAPQQAHAGAEADRGEEHVLQRRLQRGVEGEAAGGPLTYSAARMAATGSPPTTGAGML